MAEVRIFYSWQSDLPNATNRSFIESAIEKAIKRIRTDDTLGVVPVVDRDTQGVPGAPDIVHAIFDKIEHAHLFVCDVSIINAGSSSRPSPNPNVLIELGYALRHLSPSRVLLIFNTHFGSPEQLPFDLKLKRVITYEMSPTSSEKANERDRLSKVLESGIRGILSAQKFSDAAVVFDGGASELTFTAHSMNASPDDKAELVSRVVCVNLELRNLGSTPLTDVECFLSFPEDLQVLEKEHMTAYWSAYPNDVLTRLVEKMGTRQSIGEMLSESFSFSLFQMRVGVRSQRPKYSPRQDVKADISNREVRFRVRKLKHGIGHCLEPLYIIFPAYNEIRSFSFTYRIHADTLITEGQLHVSTSGNG